MKTTEFIAFQAASMVSTVLAFGEMMFGTMTTGLLWLLVSDMAQRRASEALAKVKSIRGFAER
jgi:hypothetical protein